MEVFNLNELFKEDYQRLKEMEILPFGATSWGAIKDRSRSDSNKFPSHRFKTKAYHKPYFYKLVSRML